MAPLKPVCVECGKPADPVRDATAQKGVFLHDRCSRALVAENGWNRLADKKKP